MSARATEVVALVSVQPPEPASWPAPQASDGLQSVFERIMGLYSDVGDARTAFEVSENRRSRVLLDAVRGRASVSAEASNANGT